MLKCKEKQVKFANIFEIHQSIDQSINRSSERSNTDSTEKNINIRIKQSINTWRRRNGKKDVNASESWPVCTRDPLWLMSGAMSPITFTPSSSSGAVTTVSASFSAGSDSRPVWTTLSTCWDMKERCRWPSAVTCCWRASLRLGWDSRTVSNRSGGKRRITWKESGTVFSQHLTKPSHRRGKFHT